MAGAGPRVAEVLELAAARAPELQALRELVHRPEQQQQQTSQAEHAARQRRRRANAFNSFRMPQRLRRQGHRARLKGAEGPQAAERRSRAHERRPRALAESRAWAAGGGGDGAAWLPTHVWHAKRMRMGVEGGVAVARSRTDKGVSAALEALRKTAVVHDVSYYGVLEMAGRPQLLLEALQLVADPAGSEFDRVKFLSGAEEGSSMLYHSGEFPNGAICPVTFMWRPMENDWSVEDDGNAKFELQEGWEDTKRQLWLWIHPAAFMEAATAIADACRQVVGEDEEIQILDRRGHLCRFKVRGKRTDQIVASFCEDVVQLDDELEPMNIDESDHDDSFDAHRSVKVCSEKNRKALLLYTQRLAKGTKPVEDASAEDGQRIFSVAVGDPRSASYDDISFKPTRMTTSGGLSLLKEPPQSAIGKVGEDDIVSPLTGESLSALGKRAEEPDTAFILSELSAVLSWTIKANPDATSYPYKSPRADTISSVGNVEPAEPVQANQIEPTSWLWSQMLRKKLADGFRRDHELNADILRKRRAVSKQLSSELPTGVRESSTASAESLLHLLAVRKSASFPNGSGWDLICCPSMAPALLKALVFRGAMAVGTDEDSAISTVLHIANFPCDFPDTKTGQEYWSHNAKQLQEEQEKKPKAKRVAFEKLGVLSPFEPNWSALFDLGAKSDAIKRSDNDTDEEMSGEESDSLCVLRGDTYMQPFCFSASRTENPDGPTSFIPVALPTLVRVVVSVVSRGTLTPNTMLYMPSNEDLGEIKRDVKWRGTEVARVEQRVLMGFVTSAVYDRPKAAFRAIGFSSCESLQRLFLAQKVFGTAIALARPPQGKLLRPVHITVAI